MKNIEKNRKLKPLFLVGNYTATFIMQSFTLIYNAREIRKIIDEETHVHTTGDYDCNDRIGFINKIHEGPGYDAGIHSVASTNGDDPNSPNAKPNFTLRYTIFVEPIPK